ncbi:hypothetical protein D0865_11846 [Hortaea werneckii]|uniref:Uncharacterized protein n=1 Tax=Hortaea werneckii TaxID=91943 RepID=A0A3M7BSA8_HORWE|nr:hypothetical protein D0865_11846 [Hortaea werneckii]
MVDKKKAQAVASFDTALQASRQERNAKLAQEMLGTDPKKLAQEMLGSKNRRTSTPKATAAPASLASRVGVQKVRYFNMRWTSSKQALTTTQRSSSLPRSHTAPPRNPRQPSHLSRPPITDNSRSRASYNAPSYDSASDAKSNGRDVGLNIRGAASGPHVIRAQNFAPGTTAADIESVMQNIGGPTHYSQPTRQEEPLGFVEDKVGDVDMDVDEHAEDRAAQDRAREMHRGRSKRDNRNGRPQDYDDRRYYDDRGYGGGDRRFGAGGGRRGYNGRGYPTGPRHGGQSWRP